MPPSLSDWAGIELDRRLARAKTPGERDRVRREAEQARRSPAALKRLADIAQYGRFQSGPWEKAQYGLAAGTLAPLLPYVGSLLGPVGTGIGTAAALGLGAIGGLNLAEGASRRSEGLPGSGMQMGFGAADVLTAGGGSRILRGLRSLRGAKPPPAAAFQPGYTYSAQGPQRWTPTSHPVVSDAPLTVKPAYASGSAARSNLLETELTNELDQLLPSRLAQRVAQGGGTVGRPQSNIPDPRSRALGFQPDVTYRGGELPNVTRAVEGYEGLPSALATQLRRRAVPAGGRLVASGRGASPEERLLRESLTRELDLAVPSRLAPGEKAGIRGGAVGSPGPNMPDPRSPALGFQPQVRYPTLKSPPLAEDAVTAVGRAATAAGRAAAGRPGFRPGYAYRAEGPRPVHRVEPDPTMPRDPTAPTTGATPSTTAATPAGAAAPAGALGIRETITQIESSLASDSGLRPAIQWWKRQALEVGEVADTEEHIQRLMQRGIGAETAAKLLARAGTGARKGGVARYKKFKKTGEMAEETVRKGTAGEKTMADRRPPGPTFVETVTISNQKKSVDNFLASVDQAEKDVAKADLLGGPGYRGVQERLGLSPGGGVPPPSDPQRYLDYRLALSGRVMANRMVAAQKVLKGLGLVDTQTAARIDAVLNESFLRAHHSMASTGRRTIDVAGTTAREGRAGQPMQEDMVEWINSLQEVTAALGMLFAGIFTAQQMMPGGPTIDATAA